MKEQNIKNKIYSPSVVVEIKCDTWVDNSTANRLYDNINN